MNPFFEMCAIKFSKYPIGGEIDVQRSFLYYPSVWPSIYYCNIYCSRNPVVGGPLFQRGNMIRTCWVNGLVQEVTDDHCLHLVRWPTIFSHYLAIAEGKWGK
jgi:hypothetical protein